MAQSAGTVPTSAAKRALRVAVAAWRDGRGAAPQILQSCDACGEERWWSLDRRHGQAELDARLPGQVGARADLAFADGAGRVRLVVQLADGSRLPNRPETLEGVPVVVLSGAAVAADPLRWRPVRASRLPRWRCRCASARPLPVDDAFSLRVIGCPLKLRRDDTPAAGASVIDGLPAASASVIDSLPAASASVIHDCARCGFFVGIGYADPERRRVSLYCSFGAAGARRLGPAPAPRLPADAVAGAAASRL